MNDKKLEKDQLQNFFTFIFLSDEMWSAAEADC